MRDMFNAIVILIYENSIYFAARIILISCSFARRNKSVFILIPRITACDAARLLLRSGRMPGLRQLAIDRRDRQTDRRTDGLTDRRTQGV